MDKLTEANAASAAFAKATAVAGIDIDALIDALLSDCPYDLYWFDKTRGIRTACGVATTLSGEEIVAVRVTHITVRMAVAADYAAGTFTVNELPGRVNAAVANIEDIVGAAASLGDLDMLRAYADRVCALTAYNHQAAGGAAVPYGDPWQLVYVFDGDPDTQVVCEGYAKAFKYLCDLSDFPGGAACVLVTGEMRYGTGEGEHGRRYLVDLTNSDAGDSCDGALFLKGCAGSGDSYTCNGLSYTFDEHTISAYGAASPWLSLSRYDYGKGYRVEVLAAEYGEVDASAALVDAGDAVALTLAPEAGYAPQTPEVRRGDSVVIPSGGGDRWSFVMPFGDVTVSTIFEYVPKAIACAAADYEGVYDGAAHGISLTVSEPVEGATVKYGESYDRTESPAYADAGIYTVCYRVTAKGYAPFEGSARVNIHPRTAKLAWGEATFAYDGKSHKPAATVGNLVPGDVCTVSVGGAQTNYGHHTAAAVRLSNPNYALPASTSKAFTIKKRTAVLNWEDLTFTYDGKSHKPAATVGNLVAGDECAVSVGGAQTNYGHHTATAVRVSNPNYALPAANTRAFTIKKRTVGLVWGNTVARYDGQPHAPTARATGLASGDSCRVTVTDGRTNAGSWTAKAVALSNPNYALPSANTQTFTIERRPVHLEWTNTTLYYNGKPQAPTATIPNLLPGDECAVTVAGAQTDKGHYVARAVALSNPNYRLPASDTQRFRIRQLTIGLVWTDLAFAWDGGIHVPTATATGLLPGDSCEVRVTGGKRDVGRHIARAYRLSNVNYRLPEQATRAFRITE